MSSLRPAPRFILSEPMPLADFLRNLDFQHDGVWYGFRLEDGKVVGKKLEGNDADTR